MMDELPPPINQVTRVIITTNEAAYYLNRKPQTLRIWAMSKTSLVSPIRVNGRLGWPVSEIKKVLGLGG